MAVDVAPEILEDITEHFEEAWAQNQKLPQLMDKLRSGTATYAEANEYASEVGRMMKKAYEANLSSSRLPDGKCYFNIADRIIKETEHMQYVRVSDYTRQVQQSLNDKAGIGLKAITSEEDTRRVKGLIEVASHADQYDDVSKTIPQGIESMSREVVDNSVKANADFQYKAGLRPRIIRSGGSGCCEWCSGLTGKYDYPDVPDDVYARHNNCTCTVEYTPGDGKRQNVWSKKWMSAEGVEKRENLKTLGLDSSDRKAKIEYRKSVGKITEINAQKRADYAEKRENLSERQRLDRKYSNSVQIQALDAPGFVEKFQGITGIEKVDNSLYECAVKILDHRNGTSYEDIYFIDAINGDVLHGLTTCDIPNGVIYDEETKKIIKQAQQEGRKIITIHNHPGGLPPSMEDGVSAYDPNYGKGVAVGHNLEVYEYTPADNSYTEEQCKEVHKNLNEVFQFTIEFDDSIWYNALKEYGMEVIRR